MKKNIITLVLLLSAMVALSCLFSCGPDRSDTWEARRGPKGDSVVYVRSYDNNGNMLEYYMQYALFHQLFSNGGYNSVNNYYSGHRSYFEGPSYSEYRKYQPIVRPTPVHVNSTTHSRVSTGSSSNSFSSPVRSSSSARSFSSPVKSSSYSSGSSRSFSSPSRSFRSPSRSFSSPSHH